MDTPTYRRKVAEKFLNDRELPMTDRKLAVSTSSWTSRHLDEFRIDYIVRASGSSDKIIERMFSRPVQLVTNQQQYCRRVANSLSVRYEDIACLRHAEIQALLTTKYKSADFGPFYCALATVLESPSQKEPTADGLQIRASRTRLPAGSYDIEAQSSQLGISESSETQNVGFRRDTISSVGSGSDYSDGSARMTGTSLYQGREKDEAATDHLLIIFLQTLANGLPLPDTRVWAAEFETMQLNLSSICIGGILRSINDGSLVAKTHRADGTWGHTDPLLPLCALEVRTSQLLLNTAPFKEKLQLTTKKVKTSSSPQT
jgi:hypothetical protein